MDALFPAYNGGLTLVIASSIIVLAMLVGCVVAYRRGNDGTHGLIIVFSGLIVYLVTYAIIMMLTQGANDAAKDAQTEWVESHGVSLTDDALDDLKFPEDRPDGDEDYGIVQVIRDKAIVDVHLAWEDEEFVLYGTDGQPLEVLKR